MRLRRQGRSSPVLLTAGLRAGYDVTRFKSSLKCARINDEPEKEPERYLTTDEQKRMFEVMVGDLLDYVRAPFEVSLHTGLRKNVELLKLKVAHLLHFASNVFRFTVVTKVYACATQSVLEAAVEKLTKPLGQVVEFGRKVG